MPWYRYVIGALGLALLMIVHEAGHFLAARAHGMRVIKFSIGFGPTIFKVVPEEGYYWFTTAAGRLRLRLWRHDPEKHGPTVFQVAAIPFLAYVQIAGMNPLEEIDPNDKGSYANASLPARIAAIFAGPFANYVFASIVFFLVFATAGKKHDADTTVVAVLPDRPAAMAGFKSGDRIVEVAGTAVPTWSTLAQNIEKHPAEKIPVVVERGGARVTIEVTPANEQGKGKIGVMPSRERVPQTMKGALVHSLKEPANVVVELFAGLKKWFREGSVKELGGPKAIVEQTAAAAGGGWAELTEFLAMLSAYLGAFNLIPFPALDGGRLIFLGYEAATRRRANPRIEAVIHGVGLIMLLGLMGYVTVFNDILGQK